MRPGDDAVGAFDRLIGVDDRRPRRAVVGGELASRLDGIVGQDADDGQIVGPVLLELPQELRELVPARDAGRTPEIDDDRSTSVRREIERLAVERQTDDRRGWLADRGVRPKGVAVYVPPDAGRG